MDNKMNRLDTAQHIAFMAYCHANRNYEAIHIAIAKRLASVTNHMVQNEVLDSYTRFAVGYRTEAHAYEMILGSIRETMEELYDVA